VVTEGGQGWQFSLRVIISGPPWGEENRGLRYVWERKGFSRG